MVSISKDNGTPNPVSPNLHYVKSSAAKADESTVEACGDEEERGDIEKPGENGVREAKFKRGPKEPTEKEVLAHNATHVPFT